MLAIPEYIPMFGFWNFPSLDVVTAKQTEFSTEILTDRHGVIRSTAAYRTLTGQNFSLIIEIGLQHTINVILTTLQRFRSLSCN